MNRWTPNIPASSPRRWQSREEIVKAHFDSLTPSELRREHPYHYWLRYGPRARKSNRWQSREEIVKEHLDSLSPSELLQVRPDYYWLRFGLGARNRDHARKYDPNQPRVPSGNPGGGQWTTEGGSEDIADNPLESFAMARRRGKSTAYCVAQYAIDGLLCNSLQPASRRAICRGQAAERYANCLSGRPIPPLNY